MRLNSCKSHRKKLFCSYRCLVSTMQNFFFNNFGDLNSCKTTIDSILSVHWDLHGFYLKTKDTYIHLKGLMSLITIATILNILTIFPVLNIYLVLQFLFNLDYKSMRGK